MSITETGDKPKRKGKKPPAPKRGEKLPSGSYAGTGGRPTKYDPIRRLTPPARDSWRGHAHLVETRPRFKAVRVATWGLAVFMVGAAAFAVVNAKMERAQYTRLDLRGS